MNSLYTDFIYTRTYSRWIDEEQRRECWPETVTRYHSFFDARVKSDELKDALSAAVKKIHDKEVMPSMRALWTAGPALERENIAGFNCAYTPIDCLESLSEMLYILMCGTGVGFSVERQFITKLPIVPEKFDYSDTTIIVADSKEGWAYAYRDLLNCLFDGSIPQVDFSLVRPTGSRLKIFGGRASGPGPLQDLFAFTLRTVLNAVGRKLSSIEVHDICCYIASIVVVGGVRRSACISFSNLSDDRMASAKDGEFYIKNPQRGLANNSVAYTEKPGITRFMEEWLSLVKSNSGERGIFNAEGSKKFISTRGTRDTNHEFRTNPCGEILLRPNQFCNLTEVIVRPNDTLHTLKNKIRSAVLLGCMQSTLTKFNLLRDIWRQNTEEERLLGVSLTGLRDHPLLCCVSPISEEWLSELRIYARDCAAYFSKLLDIPCPAAVTTVKPSGTVAQLVDCSPGLHPAFSRFYIRRVRVAATDPLCKLLIDKGVPYSPEVGQSVDNATTYVFGFPCKAKETSILRENVTAIEQLEYWKMLKTCWCDHNPSITVYVKEFEWLEVGSWVYKNWDIVGGLTFLPYSDSVYRLAPYEEISELDYNSMLSAYDWDSINLVDDLVKYEKSDTTSGAREFACSGGGCEIN